ncbi:MAG: endonuclease/exonuclease/phosphatase family protein [Bdellovibrionales bacterium]|nr:endonuclease/exonuclease/phosphatase family protein [Bdellovibrionales bacterium]
MGSKLVLSALSLFIFSTSHAKPIEFTVMSYNVENLFDTLHDEGKADYAYLPLTVKRSMPSAMEYCRNERIPPYRAQCFNQDWNEDVLNTKIQNIAEVIKAYDKGQRPDILVVQEVENLNVLNMLNEQGGLGYQTVVLLEGDDQRGIDVGILSKYPLAGEPKIHYIDKSRKIKTRGILEARFHIQDKVVAVFANHWPSQSNPDELRSLAAKKLLEVLPKAKADVRIAAGDFNTNKNDNPHGINETLLKPKRGLYFVETNPELKDGQPSGSHWYQGKWEFLDRMFIDSKSAGNAEIDFSVHVKPFMLMDRILRDRRGNETVHQVPNRFNADESRGYSDHLPIVSYFKIK